MTTIELVAAGRKAPYFIREGILGELREVLGAVVGDRRKLVVTDANVAPLYGEDIARRLAAPMLVLPAGERNKSWTGAEAIVHFLLGNGVERSDVVVAVGGGVITDLAGFAASVTLRGLPWVAVPTTLLGMVDAAIGGKTGIDLDLGKNLVGTFWQPHCVVADPLALATLDQRQLRAGLAEVVKSAMIDPGVLEHVLDEALATIARGGILQASELVAGAARVKAEIVALDERETGPRQALNLGHTLAHALEASTEYGRLLHGEAVAWGLLADLRLARDRGLLSTAEAQTWAGRLQALAPLPPIADLRWTDLASYIARDKKRRKGSVEWVLPKLGGVVLGCEVAEGEIGQVFREIAAIPDDGHFTALF